jgi:hypothetical protein
MPRLGKLAVCGGLRLVAGAALGGFALGVARGHVLLGMPSSWVMVAVVCFLPVAVYFLAGGWRRIGVVIRHCS